MDGERRPSPDLATPTITATTIGELLLGAADRSPQRTAVVFPDERVGFAQLADEALEVARGLRALGVDRGDHVGILMPNTVDTIRAFFGIALAGAVVVPLNARYRRTELAYVVENADLVALFTTDVIDEHVDFVELLQASLPGLAEAPDAEHLALPGAPRLRTAILLGSKEAPGMVSAQRFRSGAATVDTRRILTERHRIRIRDTAVMPYTSGTTADPKGCLVSHETLVRDWLGVSRRMRLGAGDSVWAPCPMFHMAGIGPLVASAARGATFVSALRFDPKEAVDVIETEGITHLYAAFPTIMMPLLSGPDFAPERFATVRAMMNVAPPDTLRLMQSRLPHVVQSSAYGMTEGGSTVSMHDFDDDHEARMSTCGPPLDGVEVRIVDAETLAELPVGGEGEIQFRGFNTFSGYYRDPDKTADTMLAGGWVRSGDLGRMNEQGHVSYLGRIKDMLKVGGENVAPAEIESYLSTHPAVLLVQVVGRPDDKYGEVPVAFVQLTDPGAVTADDLIEYCRGEIASFKIPGEVRFVTEWPMSATKIQKFRLKAMVDEGDR